MDTITYKDKKYPLFQTLGNASQFAIPYAKYFCKGTGVDIGCKNKEWAFPNAIPIDVEFNDGFDAMNLPIKELDYIYSSHCLEHIFDWVATLEYWTECLRESGTLFLYLPHYSQEYWRPWNNRKHKHVLTQQVLFDYMKSRYTNIFFSERDLNDSFIIVGEKCSTQ